MNTQAGTPEPVNGGEENTRDVGATVVELLAVGGLRTTVESWLGNGPNEAVTDEQVTDALGAEVLGSLAEHAGVSTEHAAQALAERLPDIVDSVSPEGQASPATSRDLQLAIRNDGKLNRLLGNVTIAQGGALPNIHQSLLPTKSKKDMASEEM